MRWLLSFLSGDYWTLPCTLHQSEQSAPHRQHSALRQNMEQVGTSSDITQQMPHASTSQSYIYKSRRVVRVRPGSDHMAKALAHDVMISKSRSSISRERKVLSPIFHWEIFISSHRHLQKICWNACNQEQIDFEVPRLLQALMCV